MKITLQYLDELLQANTTFNCFAPDAFRELFPDGAEISADSIEKCQGRLSLPYFLDEVATAYIRNEILQLESDFYYIDYQSPQNGGKMIGTFYRNRQRFHTMIVYPRYRYIKEYFHDLHIHLTVDYTQGDKKELFRIVDIKADTKTSGDLKDLLLIRRPSYQELLALPENTISSFRMLKKKFVNEDDGARLSCLLQAEEKK